MVEDIQAGIAKVIRQYYPDIKRVDRDVTTAILTYLDSQGIVRTVAGEEPPIQERFTARENMRRLKAGGWTKTERLV